jgi:hypothetical protein
MTQQQALLDLFKKGKTLNLISAFKLTGCMKLSCRVNDTFIPMGYVFKKEKVNFQTRYKTHGYYFEYTLDRKKTPKRLLK